MDSISLEQLYKSRGFNKDGINLVTGIKYDENGYDAHGFDKNGFNAAGFHRETHTLYAPDGFSRKGFNKQGINKETGTKYDKNGYDKYGTDARGFRKSGTNSLTKTKYDEKGYDINGFNKNGEHQITKTKYDLEGYDQKGYDKDGYNRNGYNSLGFNREGFNVLTNSYFDKKGYDVNGYDSKGFNKEGIHKDTNTIYNKDGIDINGNSKKSLEEAEKKMAELCYLIADKKITVSKFLDITDKTASECYTYAFNNLKLTREQHIALKTFVSEYNKYLIPLNEEYFLESFKVIVGKNVVAPTKEDIELCKEYLINNDIHICQYTFKNTLVDYLNGNIKIEKNKTKKKIK